MKNSSSPNSPDAPATVSPDGGFSPWQRLKTKRISYLTLPLLIMATVTEFVILATGWKYQQVVCLPKGMGVTFFGIGPIGATILAVELLKLPLAIWTASRYGWQKFVMMIIGLPLICLLTFQLVKDMAVYEMGVAMTPASQMLEEATKEEVKISQLDAELGGIAGKKADRDRKLAELAARKAKAKADLEEALKRNEDSRMDAISLTDYQKKELSEVEARQATIIRQFDADAQQLTKAMEELRTRREPEAERAARWNSEEARIDNAYKAKLADYTNKKAAYDKDKAEYDKAGFLKRQVLKEPVDPGVPPERESNMILKPTIVADIDAQIKAKEAELLAVNNKRRDSVAQVDADARRLRGEFDNRSSTKREETDRKREQLLAANATLATQWVADEKQINSEYETAAQKADGIRAELDDARKKAEGFYEAREAAIKNTQVHRIATTVEIVRGLFKGQRPVSIKSTAKERGDLYTDQISMVRIWVYPVLAFIVAFLPTLMVEIGFSTLFHPEQKRPAYRLGFFGRRLHRLYIRAGRQKILRAERMVREVSSEIAIRDKALAEVKAGAEKSLAEKETEVQAAYENQCTMEAAREKQLRLKEEAWSAKLAEAKSSLAQAVAEKDALRNFNQAEIDRQVQLRQSSWSDRLAQARQELEALRAANEEERTFKSQEHHKKLLEVAEEWRNQVLQVRRQLSDVELAAEEKSSKLAFELKEALNERDAARSQLQLDAESLSLRLTQAKEDATREMEKAARQEKNRLEGQVLEFTKTLRQSKEEFERQMKQREQEMRGDFDKRVAQEQARMEQESRRREGESEHQMEARTRELEARWNQELQQREVAAQARLKQREQQLQAQAEVNFERQMKQREQEWRGDFDKRVAQEQARVEDDARRREEEFEHQTEARIRELEARWNQELQQREVTAQARLKQREQQLQAQAEIHLRDAKEEAEEQLRRRELEFERTMNAQAREAEARWREELQQKELAFHAKLKQREQALSTKAVARENELQNQWAADLRTHEEEWGKQTESLVRATETRLALEAQQREEVFQLKMRQREQQLQGEFDGRQLEVQMEWEQELRRRDAESAEAKKREAMLVEKLKLQAEAHQAAEKDWLAELESARATIEPLKALLARTEVACDLDMQTASEGVRKVQDLKKKLNDAALTLNGLKSGKGSNGQG